MYNFLSLWSKIVIFFSGFMYTLGRYLENCIDRLCCNISFFLLKNDRNFIFSKQATYNKEFFWNSISFTLKMKKISRKSKFLVSTLKFLSFSGFPCLQYEWVDLQKKFTIMYFLYSRFWIGVANQRLDSIINWFFWHMIGQITCMCGLNFSKS